MFQAHHEGGSVVDQAKVPFVQRKEECIGKQNVHRELVEHILLSQIIERSLHWIILYTASSTGDKPKLFGVFLSYRWYMKITDVNSLTLLATELLSPSQTFAAEN